MKKVLVLLALVWVCAILVAYGQQRTALTKIEDTNNSTASCTNYVGFANVTAGATNTVSTDAASWMIIRTTLDASGNELTYQHAYNTNYTDQFWKNVWTNRASASYK